MDASQVLNREFLEIRCKLIELAASFDRLGRSRGSVAGDPRLAKIREALQILLDGDADRAEQLQLLFSREYDDNWQETLAMPNSAT